MGLMDPLYGIDVTRSDKMPYMVPDAEVTSVGILRNTNILGSSRKTSLHLASEGGSVEVVRSLLDEGVDVNQRDAGHRTALHLSSF